MQVLRLVAVVAAIGLTSCKVADDQLEKYRSQYGMPPRPLLADVRDVQSVKLGFYYLHPQTAEDGISAGCDQLEKQPNHRTVQAFCALANWNVYQSDPNPKYHAAFLKWSDELNSSADDGRWIWTIEIPGLGIKPPWISGLTQALGVSVLLRAYQLTGNEKYMSTARRAMEWISKSLEDGGCSSTNERGTWIEEYPNVSEPNHVLNGHLWALFGVWDFYRVTRDEDAKKLFADGVRVVEAEIERYDVGYWVVYSQKNRLDNILGLYMQFVVEQLKAMYAITENPFFMKYAEKWAAYQRDETLFSHLR